LHYPPPEGRRSYPMTAIVHDTPSSPHGPWVFPGEYSVKLTVNGQTYTQPLTIKTDPRIKTPAEDLRMTKISETQKQMRDLRAQLTALSEKKGVETTLADYIPVLNAKVGTLECGGFPGRGGGRKGADDSARPTLSSISGQFSSILATVQATEAKPTTQVTDAAKKIQGNFETIMTPWQDTLNKEIPALNKKLQEAKLPLINIK
jgi:hypothetical protein